MTDPWNPYYFFLTGITCAGYLVASLFFVRFWRRTGDSLFAAFACAFLLLALNQSLVALLDRPVEEKSGLYLLRLAAYGLIIWAVVHKSRRR